MRPLCPRSPGRRRAFTLIELLTVIAIIGILAAIIIPTVGKVRDSARKSVCQSNVRQIATAFLTYSSDNRGLLPPANLTVSGGTASWASGALYPYLYPGQEAMLSSDPRFAAAVVNNQSVFRCPSSDDSIVYSGTAYPLVEANASRHGFGYNPMLPPYNWSSAPTVAAADLNAFKQLNTVQNPSRTVLVADYPGASMTSASALRGAGPRHGGRVHAAMCDASVKTLSATSTTDNIEIPANSGASTASRMFWNGQ